MNALLNDTASWSLIVGVLLPLLTSAVQQPRWSTSVRAAVAGIAAIIGGVVTCLANGTLHDGSTLLGAVAVVLVAAQATYMGFWQPLGVSPRDRVRHLPIARRRAAARRVAGHCVVPPPAHHIRLAEPSGSRHQAAGENPRNGVPVSAGIPRSYPRFARVVGQGSRCPAPREGEAHDSEPDGFLTPEDG